MDERMGVVHNLVEQSADSVNKMSVTVNDLQQKLSAQSGENAQKLDQVSSQVQSLHDRVDELKSRLAKISKQLDDMQNGGQNLAAGQPGAVAPSADAGRSRAAVLPRHRSASGGRAVQQRAARLQRRQI